MSLVQNFFDAIYLVSLEKRTDRRERFYNEIKAKNIPWNVKLFTAIDGTIVGHPDWYGTSGAWGCFSSHFTLLNLAISENRRNILIFEDDCAFENDFCEKLEVCLNELPEDWGMFYLGGQHLKSNEHPQTKVSDHVIRSFNVNRTHAYAINSSVFGVVHNHLSNANKYHCKKHIDHILGELHETGRINVYATNPWLCCQDEGFSDIANRKNERYTWNNSILIKQEETKTVKKEPLFDIIDHSVAYGSLGIDGLLGYEGKSVSIGTEYNDVQKISAHAPSRIELNIKKPSMVAGYQNQDGNSRNESVFVVDGEQCGAVQRSGSMTKWIDLDVGSHVLEFQTAKNAMSHTVFLIKENEEAQAKSEKEEKPARKNSTKKNSTIKQGEDKKKENEEDE